MENKNLYRIEFNKVLEMLSEETSSQDAKDMCLMILPSRDIKSVQKLLHETSAAYQLSVKLGFPPFNGIKCISELLNRVNSGAILSNLDLLNILSTIKCIRKIKEWRKTGEKINTCIDYKFEQMIENNYLENKIAKSIISEKDISDQASIELSEIRHKISNLNNTIKEKMNKMINSMYYRKYLMDSIITTRSGRFVVPVKSEYKVMIKGLVHDVSASGLTIFIEPIGVVEDNNKINELKNMEKNEIEKILIKFSREIAKFSDAIYNSYLHLLDLDIIFAKVSLAFKMKASVPKINDKGIINLKSARHPLISIDEVQPIDIELGKNFDTLIITGPNTGGKTVSIKMLGLMCAMAMCGLMIPAGDDSEVSVFENILTDIGDEQSIEKSISTFSSHIKNIISILNESGNNTLVLIDEIGSGTDPEEGAALAISIIEELRKRDCKVVVTTHYKELKEYAFTTKRVQSASCEFDINTMKPTYKLYLGGLGSSNAFIISEKLGIDKNIINRAEKLLGEEKVNLNKFLNLIEKTKSDLEIQKQYIEKLYKKAKEEKVQAEIEMKKIEKNRDKLIEESRRKAVKILEKVRIDSEKIFRELNNAKSSGNILSPEQRRSIRNQIESLEKLMYKEEKYDNKIIEDIKFKKGDIVFISNIEKEGTVVCEEDDSGNILVNIGVIKTRVSKKHLKLKQDKKTKKQDYKAVFNRIMTNNKINSSMEIDLRGKSSDEAIHELGMFIDNSIMSGFHQITIIHGKGTGVLKREIHKYLKNNISINNFRLGVFGEGEAGVTIAELR